MGLFVSYSSQDRSAIEPLTAALRRARQQVWFDEDLGGGEAWWKEILEQIRSCEVFIVALSNRSLESKPCQAEWRYAQALQRPILPVRIGPVDSMRANPLAALQVIDYQNPSVDTGIQLVSAVHALAAQQRKLPSPLPDEPPVPFAYLMRLSSTLAEQDLDPKQQTHLVTELKSGLEEDGDDPTARNDIARLLRMLRDRSDVTYRTRTEIDNLLASVDTKSAAPADAPASRPQYEHPVARATTPAPPGGTQPVPGATTQPEPPKTTGGESTTPAHPTTGPQPSTQPRVSTRASVRPGAGGPDTAQPSRKPWLIAGGVGLAVVVAIVAAVVFFTQQPGPKPSSAPAGAPANDLSAILLSTADVSTIMGTSMEPATQTEQMLTAPGTVSNSSCLGGLDLIQAQVYQGSGFTTVRGQGLRSTNPPHRVYEAAVEFPGAEKAHAFVRTSANSWNACAGQTVTVNSNNQTTSWTFAEVNGAPPRIVQRHTEAVPNGRVCQHVLSAVSHVVIEVQACGVTITNEAGQIADQMAARVKQ
jgi:serine/threonine kinase PknH